MSFDWKLYIQLAGELINHQRNPNLQEAYLRSAVSRSYYGIFCIARNILSSRGINIPRTDTHKFVREEYKKSKNKIEREIGENLHRLWGERKNADYEDEEPFNIYRAEIAYELAIRTNEKLINL